jgi:hypothetical protein
MTRAAPLLLADALKASASAIDAIRAADAAGAILLDPIATGEGLSLGIAVRLHQVVLLLAANAHAFLPHLGYEESLNPTDEDSLLWRLDHGENPDDGFCNDDLDWVAGLARRTARVVEREFEREAA